MLERARIIKGVEAATARVEHHARILPREVLAARDEAARIVAEARANVVHEVEKATNEAREAEIARLSAIAIGLKNQDEARAERDLDRTIEVAKLLAERLVGEQLTIQPARIAELAVAALEQTRGARDIRIDAHPADVPALSALLESLELRAAVQADDALGRGSLVVHTDLGDVDARLTPQLARLATVLKEPT